MTSVLLAAALAAAAALGLLAVPVTPSTAGTTEADIDADPRVPVEPTLPPGDTPGARHNPPARPTD